MINRALICSSRLFAAAVLASVLACSRVPPSTAPAPATMTTSAEVSSRTTPVPIANPGVRQAMSVLANDNAWTLEQQISICEIPAPPFKERTRALEFARRLRLLGIANAHIDAEGNVIGERHGAPGEPVVVLGAHLDTVFPEGTDVRVRRDGDTLRGPGIGDDCRGLAVLLSVARALENVRIHTRGTVIFVGTVGEEGPGNLRGVRHLFDVSLKDRVDYFVSVDGTGLDITSGAVGSYRYRVTYHGPGGHSYGAFGMPNPIHALGRAIALISEIQVLREPKTTFAVGVIDGGTSVNSIAATASMDVDLRSESPAALVTLDSAFRVALATALSDERARWPASRARLDVRIDTIGIRPAGSQPDSVMIVRVALESGRALAFTPRTGFSSTDANIPISRGIPAITIDGGGSGRGAHSPEESYTDTARGYLGPQWALLIVLTLAGIR